jgi:glucosylglycerate synthase
VSGKPDGLPIGVAERLDAIGRADVVIGLPSGADADLARAVAGCTAANPGTPGPVQAVVVVPGSGGSDGGDPDGGGALDASVRLVRFPFAANDGLPGLSAGHAEAGHAILVMARRLSARASVMLTGAVADPSASALLQPVLQDGLDLVVPCHARRKFEGLIGAAIAYPLTRALYGKRVRCPLVADFCASADLGRRFLDSRGGSDPAAPLEWLLGEALAGDMKVGQVRAGPRPPMSRDPGDLGTVLSRVVGALFDDIERHAAAWQTIRGSAPVPIVGTEAPAPEDPARVDVRNLVESFQLGYRNLADLWGEVLPPATQLDLRKLGRAAPDAFTMPDDVWARVVYDFALGSRLRVMNRDHLLRAMVPLYLGWVASYAAEVARLGPGGADARIERLCLAYERQKPYFLSRWRWPDRFSP